MNKNEYFGSSFHCISYLAIDIETASVGNASGLKFIWTYIELHNQFEIQIERDIKCDNDS